MFTYWLGYVQLYIYYVWAFQCKIYRIVKNIIVQIIDYCKCREQIVNVRPAARAYTKWVVADQSTETEFQEIPCLRSTKVLYTIIRFVNANKQMTCSYTFCALRRHSQEAIPFSFRVKQKIIIERKAKPRTCVAIFERRNVLVELSTTLSKSIRSLQYSSNTMFMDIPKMCGLCIHAIR